MKARRGPQRFAFRPVMAVMGACLLLFAGALTAAYQYRAAGIERHRQLSVQAKILAASVTAAIAFNDRATAQEYVNALMLDPRLDAAAVFDDSHHPVAGFQRQGSEPIVEHEVLDTRAPGDRLLVEVPARQGTTNVGSVYLRGADTPVIVQLARYSGVALLTIMAVLMLSALGVAQRILTRANEALQRRASELAEANARLATEMAHRARTEEALRQSQKMEAIGQLSGGIAHDFNNLLMIIRGSLSHLQKKLLAPVPDRTAVADMADGPAGRTSEAEMLDPDQRQIKRYLDMARDGIDRAASLTQRLLSFARRQPLSPVPLNLDALIRSIRPLLDHSVGASVRIDYRLGSQWRVLCDANQMENAILNLVINARDAMPAGGVVEVCTEDVQVDAAHPLEDLPEGAYVHLRVSDAGAGMSEEVRSKAFDPFFTTKPVGKGTGLGLSTILGYVVQSHGIATIESAPGQGTTIHIVLPRTPDESSPEVA